jgi:hypothetical protein
MTHPIKVVGGGGVCSRNMGHTMVPGAFDGGAQAVTLQILWHCIDQMVHNQDAIGIHRIAKGMVHRKRY